MLNLYSEQTIRAEERLPTEIAVVTGAGSGLGRALSIELARRGVLVIGMGRRDQALEETGRFVVAGRFVPEIVDIRDDAAVTRAFADIARRFGDVTILINNAAVHVRRDVLQETYESFMDSVLVNLGGVVSCTNAALASMIRTGTGRIVNVGSFADLSPQPASAAYSVSKGAARIFSQALVADLSDRFPDIVISTWMPGILATDMGLKDGLDPAAAAAWGAELALWRDRSLNGAIFEQDREVLVWPSLKRRLLNKLLMRPAPRPRVLSRTA
ncbi:short-subunit dehydrogenase [Rhizobium sp. PP-F2F-G48]|uniref:SDR family oxidoreductase n=1 Tax=Rhizobium sp. PP-F2F-G48 TaxID=2135651 RepID=UPI001043DF3E|nr:SDR family oxidoreductase [Rhizobium sp. PP-F2F-G48]TCM49674.1 short-subunit dehydrogenase [Rhizobium sp. PP-F2F-G48]